MFPETAKMKQLITLILLGILLLTIVFLSFTGKTVIKADYVPIRTLPNDTVQIQQLAIKDKQIVVLDKQSDWSYIYYNGQRGWIKNAELTSEKINATDQAKLVNVVAENVPAFKDIRETDKEVARLDKNTQYLRYFEKDGRSQIIVNNQLAWVNSDNIREVSDTAQPTAVQKNVVVEKINGSVYVTTEDFPALDILNVNETGSTLVARSNGSGKLEDILAGNYLIKLDEGTDSYFYAQTSSGTEGYIAKSTVKETKKTKQRIGKQHTTLNGSTIVIDPGHGGEDGGASSHSAIEKEVALKTAHLLQKALEEEGAKVILTRTKDTNVSLEERAKLSNDANADVFISIHYDSTDSQVTDLSGSTVYFLRYEDALLASTIASKLKNLSLPSRGYASTSYQVLRENNSPAILLELGYMNNPKNVETFNTDTYRQQAVTEIVNGLKEYFHYANGQ